MLSWLLHGFEPITYRSWTQIFAVPYAFTHPEFSGGITSLNVCNTRGSKHLCSNGHLDRSIWLSTIIGEIVHEWSAIAPSIGHLNMQGWNDHHSASNQWWPPNGLYCYTDRPLIWLLYLIWLTVCHFLTPWRRKYLNGWWILADGAWFLYRHWGVQAADYIHRKT